MGLGGIYSTNFVTSLLSLDHCNIGDEEILSLVKIENFANLLSLR